MSTNPNTASIPLTTLSSSLKTKKTAMAIAGSLSNTSKMPSKSYGLPAKECITGSKLRKVKGSTCEDCYACKGQYNFSNVQTAQYGRLESINDPMWAAAMVRLIKDTPLFRWHDSGDLQSVKHLDDIVNIVKATPDTKHWLPTREYKFIRQWMKANGEFPSNLVVRISAAMRDSAAIDVNGLPTSGVHEHKPAIGFECGAPSRGGECGDCRACWNADVKHVSYKRH